MAKEVTIKELLKKAGVDSACHPELASYLAAHAVYALDLTDNNSESSANQTHIICKPNATKRNQRRN